MAIVGETIMDLFGGGVTVAVNYDDRTRRVVLLAVQNNAVLNEQTASFRVVIGDDIDVTVPFGYTEHTWTDGKGPLLPARRTAPRLEVHYG